MGSSEGAPKRCDNEEDESGEEESEEIESESENWSYYAPKIYLNFICLFTFIHFIYYAFLIILVLFVYVVKTQRYELEHDVHFVKVHEHVQILMYELFSGWFKILWLFFWILFVKYSGIEKYLRRFNGWIVECIKI